MLEECEAPAINPHYIFFHYLLFHCEKKARSIHSPPRTTMHKTMVLYLSLLASRELQNKQPFQQNNSLFYY